MTVLGSVVAQLQASHRTLAGEAIVYRRAGQEVTMTAVIGQSREVTVDASGVMSQVRLRDFLIRRADLDLGFGPAEPEVGDQIDVVIAGGRETWQVVPTSDERGFRASDNIGSQWRIHTQRIA